jgi:hypothetical protein
MLPRSGRDYGHRAGNGVHVLRSIFWEENIRKGEYRYRCYLVIGDMNEVTNTMNLLMDTTTNGNQVSFLQNERPRIMSFRPTGKISCLKG